MFNIFNKKPCNDPELLKRIQEDGIDYAALRFSQILIRDYLTRRIDAYNFILQELDGARQGNEQAKNFALASGIDSKEYIGTLKLDTPHLDSAQDFLIALSAKLHPKMDISISLKLKILENLMKYYGIGKYEL